MKTTRFTPAQHYAKRIIKAIDGMMENPDCPDYQDEILMTMLERPKTLRSALNAYLHKLQTAPYYRY